MKMLPNMDLSMRKCLEKTSFKKVYLTLRELCGFFRFNVICFDLKMQYFVHAIYLLLLFQLCGIIMKAYYIFYCEI